MSIFNKKTTRRTFIKGTAIGAAGIAASTSLPAAIASAVKPADEFLDYDLVGMAELIKKKAVSPREMTQVVLNRIEKMNGTINFMSVQRAEKALEEAEKVDINASPLAGVPFLYKDMLDIANVPRTDGSKIMLNNVPEQDSPYAASLRKAGIVNLGMTNVPEFTTTGLTDNDIIGPTYNPWDLAYSCIGSSGGAGGAVAAGVLPTVHGTDGGGSCRLPASACHLLGMKPSRYRIQSPEASGVHDTFKTNQTLGRTVRDSALLFDMTQDRSGKHLTPETLITGPSSRRLKIAYIRDGMAGYEVEPSVQQVQDEAAVLLRELGHEVVEIKHPLNAEDFWLNFNNAFLVKFGPLLTGIEQMTGMPVRESKLLTNFTISMGEYGQKITPEEAAAGLKYFDFIKAEFDKIHAEFDVVMSATLPIETPKVGDVSPKDEFTPEKMDTLQRTMSLTPIANTTGAPAMSVPLGFSKKTGMPVGTMFQAQFGEDRMLYELAFELELAKPWKDVWAPHSLKFS
ncbi:amidase [Thaumasiovibrio subtropicus]|uniref:amidase n=1 Tax=Thaumasiovibrio subtropicus TaxID=1891207 RepID=UPI000B35A7C1|nr:amidase family protein [Thaumasiovibrio subtropicus]